LSFIRFEPEQLRSYLEAAYDGIAATDAAAVILEAALGRLEKLAREMRGIPSARRWGLAEARAAAGRFDNTALVP
jgi:hypothetical protein